MKSIIMAVVGVVLFAASAGATWFLTQKSADAKTDDVAALQNEDPASAFPEPIEDAKKVEIMPVAIRPDIPVTVEAVTKLAQSIMKKEQALFDSQQQLRKEEQRINLLFEDLKRERDELTAFGDQIDAKILKARETTELLKQENKALSEQAKSLTTLQKKTGKTSDDVVDAEMDERVQEAKKWFKNQPPEQAANLLKEIINNGQLEFATRILDTFGDRKIPGILAAMNDEALVAELIEILTKNEKKGAETATQPEDLQKR